MSKNKKRLKSQIESLFAIQGAVGYKGSLNSL